jgi:epoxyqueuosine reductase
MPLDSNRKSAPFNLAQFGRDMGWSVAGVCDPSIPNSTQNYFDHWLENLKGTGMAYLERRKNERKNPVAYFSKAQSIFCFGLYYFQGFAKGDVKISNYAWGQDYHIRLRNLLERTASELKNIFGDFEYRSSVDTAPLLEKPLAAKAGLGWQGKNTLLLNSNFGSYLFLGELITSLPLHYFQTNLPVGDHCGTCTRCIDACPTQALSPYELDAEKCISYWTLEHKGPFNEKTPAFKNWVAGCDICQEVCPWNQKLIPLNTSSEERALQNISRDTARAEILSPEWNDRIKDRAISYVPTENWKRNLDFISDSLF